MTLAAPHSGPSRRYRRFRSRHAGALLLLLGVLAGGWLDRPMLFAGWLAAWWFCLGLVLGASANSWIHAFTGGAWGELLWPATRRMQRRLPWLLLLFLPLVPGIPLIYPWSATRAAWLASMEHPAFQQAWFTPAFLGLRLAVYGLAWWLLTRTGRIRKPGLAALALLAHVLLTSLASVDLLMSLVPGWTSTVFGWLVLIGQMTAGTAAGVAMVAVGSAFGAAPPASVRREEGAPPVWRDLGNLLLMYVLVQAYLQFMQFLIIWAENLPREISWFVPRMQTGWAWVGVALIGLQFAAPMLALLWRANKDRPRRLTVIALGVLLMQAVDAAWLVLPSVQPTGFGAWWQLPLLFAGMGLFLFGDLAEGPSAVAEPRWVGPAHG